MNKFKKISSVLAIVFIMTIFMIFLNTYSFKEKLDNLSVQRDTVVLNDAKAKIEYSIANGKEKIDYYGIDKLIDNLNASYNDSDGMIVVDNYNNLIYSTYSNDDVQKIVGFLGQLDNTENEYSYLKVKDKLISKIYINDKSGSKAGTLFNVVYISHNTKVTCKYLFAMIIIFTAGIIILMGSLVAYMNKAKLLVVSNKVVIISLLIFQMTTMIISFVCYENLVQENVQYTLDNLSVSINNNFNKIIDNNIDIDDISEIDKYIEYIESSINAVEKFNIQKTYDNNIIKYNFTYVISRSYMKNILKNNIIDAITIFIISIFFFSEISNIIKATSRSNEFIDDKRYIKIKAQSFFLFIAYNFSVFLVPIQAMNIIKNSGIILNSDIMVGIPTSTEALAIAISSILSGAIIDKMGCKKIYISGNLVLTAGLLLSYASNNIYLFILSRAVCGIGYGISLITIRTLSANCDENQISRVIAGINASAYAAVNIGSIAGGYIGEYFGISYTFLVSSILCMVGYIFCEIKMENDFVANSMRLPKVSVLVTLKSFIREKKLVTSIILVLLPISISTSFIDYFYPVYASDSIGLKLTDISKGYLLNGLIIVLTGVMINKLVSRYLSMKNRFLSAALLQGLALILFGFISDVIGLYSAIILITIAMTYAGGCFIEYYMSFNVVRNTGLAKSMSFYTLFEKTGAYLAPMIYGFILANNTQIRLILLGVYIIASINIFNLIFGKGIITYGENTKSNI